jgi:putative PIN family toxin of toxin-antitoxin system
VVLDWLVFDDKSIEPLKRLLQASLATLLVSEPARDELRRVLSYPQFKLDAPRQREVFETYASSTTLATLPEGFTSQNLMLPADFPRCRDPDDQHFLALAYHAKADALVSKDRDVLKVRRRARRFGVEIISVRELAAQL